MVKVTGSPWLAFPALGIKADTPESHTQAAVYIAQISGIDFGYGFALTGARPISLDLSVDFADWREADAPAADLPEVYRRYQAALENLGQAQDYTWLAAVCSVHYLSGHTGIPAQAFRDQCREWDWQTLSTAARRLKAAGLLQPATRPAEVVRSCQSPFLMSDKAKAQKLLDEAIAVWDLLGFTVTCQINSKTEATDGKTAHHPTLAIAGSAGSAAAA